MRCDIDWGEGLGRREREREGGGRGKEREREGRETVDVDGRSIIVWMRSCWSQPERNNIRSSGGDRHVERERPVEIIDRCGSEHTEQLRVDMM